MNKLNYIFTILVFITFSFSFESCKDEKNSADIIAESPKELAVEILQEKEKVQFNQSIFDSSNYEFCNGEIIQSMPLKMRKMILEENSDTINDADDIPVMSAESSTQNIYLDGSYTFISTDITTEDMRFIEELNLHPQPEKERVVKTIVNNNTVMLYNSDGEMISSQVIDEINFKPMLDSLKKYLNEQSQVSSTNSSRVVRENGSRMLQKALAGGMRILSQDANEIVLEIEIKNAGSVSVNKANTSTKKRIITHYSPDMSRMYSQYIYIGNQLTNSIEVEYSNNSELNLSNRVKSLSSSYFPSNNIKIRKVKTLSMKPNGVPFIKCNQETYTKNQVIYHF